MNIFGVSRAEACPEAGPESIEFFYVAVFRSAVKTVETCDDLYGSNLSCTKDNTFLSFYHNMKWFSKNRK